MVTVLFNLKRVINLCDEINIYDNSNLFIEIMNIEAGKIIWKSNNMPEWVSVIL